MKLVFLGTAGYHPSERRHTSCLMLPELGVVFDAGSGFFRVRDWLMTPTLDIFLTHAHLDHCLGLTFLLNVAYGKQLARITIHGDARKLDSIRTHLFNADLFPVLPSVEWRPLESTVELLHGHQLRHWPQRHPGGSCGYRIDGPGRSFAFVTDTTADPNAEYVHQIRDVDLLVHECNFNDAQAEFAEITGHSCATPVGQVARAANVGRLYLTHFDPLSPHETPIDLAAVRASFPNVELADDRVVVDF